MKSLTPSYMKELLEHDSPPCISLYMPADGSETALTQNMLRFDSLLRDAEAQLRLLYPSHQTHQFLTKLRDMKGDEQMFSALSDGLAVFASPALFQVHQLERRVREHVEVADSFHLKPLIRAHQFTGRFQILCLSQRNVSVWEGNQDRISPLKLKNVPKTLGEALNYQVAGATMSSSRESTSDNKQKYDTIAEKATGSDNDLDHFFRIVDKAVWANCSRPSGLPLILCAMEQYYRWFFDISKNQNIVEEGIKANPEALSPDELRERAWKVIEPFYRRQIERVVEEFGRARAQNEGSGDITQVAQAAAQARVGTLMVDADKHVGGRIDPVGRVEFGDLSRPEFDDLLDDIAEQVIKTGGQVLVMPADQMPTDTGIAAIYRF
jgi:hypothetical protein